MKNFRKSIAWAVLYLFVIAMHISILPTDVHAQTVRPAPIQSIEAFTFAYATGASNQTKITITALNARLVAIPGAVFDFYLSDQATGIGITATASSGSSDILGGVGAIFSATTSTGATNSSCCWGSKSVYRVEANSAGQITIGLTDSAKTLYFPVAQTPDGRIRAVGTRLAAANYAYLFWLDDPRGGPASPAILRKGVRA